MTQRVKNTLSKLQPLFLCSAIALVILGLALGKNAVIASWQHESLMGTCYWVLSSSIILFLLRKFFQQYSPILAVISVFTFLFAGTGITQAVAGLAFLVSAYLLGNLIYTRLLDNNENPNSFSISLLLGFSSYLFVLGLMIHIKVNYAFLYWLMLGLPLVLIVCLPTDKQRITEYFTNNIYHWNHQLSQLPYWQLATALILIGFTGSFAFIPSVMPDDVGYHLGMWTQLQFHHKYLFDVETQVWSIAPFTGDIIHGFLSVMAGDDARGARNILFYGLLLLTLGSLAFQIFSSRQYALMTVSLFASTPMLANLFGGLQTELLLALFTTLGIYFLCEPRINLNNRLLLVFLTCCILVSLKVTAVFLSLAVGLGFLIGYGKQLLQHIRFKLTTASVCLVFIVIGLCIALNCYVSSYVHTGNPVFPLYNGIFKSPYYASINIADDRYKLGASFSTYWGIFFDTRQYFESFNFCAGFQYLLLPLLGVFYFFNKRMPLIYCALPIILYGATMFYLMQYWRYFFPILPVASLLVTAALIPLNSSPVNLWLTKCSLVFFLGLNLYFFTSISWLFTTNHFSHLVPATKDAYAQKYFPEFTLIRHMNIKHPGESVLFELSMPAGASLWGKPFHPTWFSPPTLARFDQMKSADDLIVFLKEKNIRYVFWNEDAVPDAYAFREFVGQIVRERGTKEMISENVSLYRINY